ncbi:MAPK kinase substrate protein At1g80180-like [Phoenix dactylifera]|uniref:MAPK kinase substrate protein At1g80180 n=1 Tax=Phoenix dactylifera TaxID=42345 RepID=A0A8B9A005_PHODC|nr:MAPK kinase substrate protein At1g80180 [Phoenix dactylifera]XP_038978967.1 MAPK kinase substrate protein At1g80180-like [Phoenix dactylifera]
MAEAGLQRSKETFRRSGSSGLVWEDRFLPGETNHQQETNNKGEEGGGARMERSRSNGAGYRAGRVSPALDPPSPRLSVCGFCGIFGNKPAGPAHTSKPNRRHRR